MVSKSVNSKLYAALKTRHLSRAFFVNIFVELKVETVSQMLDAEMSDGRYPDYLQFLVSRPSEGKNYRVSLGTLRKYFNPSYSPQS